MNRWDVLWRHTVHRNCSEEDLWKDSSVRKSHEILSSYTTKKQNSLSFTIKKNVYNQKMKILSNNFDNNLIHFEHDRVKRTLTLRSKERITIHFVEAYIRNRLQISSYIKITIWFGVNLSSSENVIVRISFEYNITHEKPLWKKSSLLLLRHSTTKVRWKNI